MLVLSGRAFSSDKKNLTYDDASSQLPTARTKVTLGSVLIGTGIAAMAGGLTWAFLPASSSASSQLPAISADLLPGGAYVTSSLSF